MARHVSKKSAFDLLDSKAQVNNSMKWWARPIPKGSENNPWNSLPKSMDIEATSYALLAFLEAGLLDDSVPVLTWLVNQGNNFGGFTSSHDTVIGLTALYKLVTKIGVEPAMQVEYTYRPQEVERFSVTRDNAIIEQKRRVRNITDIFTISCC